MAPNYNSEPWVFVSYFSPTDEFHVSLAVFAALGSLGILLLERVCFGVTLQHHLNRMLRRQVCPAIPRLVSSS
ncbi:hypothetical protein IAD21_01648 [Abditibacteriota bacterium]|nr:hypothetical protein IAD21_01648 [Abditibacteriota bacterium]